MIRVGHSRGDATVDMRDPASIKALFTKLGQFDALVVASGSVAFNALTEMTDEQWQVGLQSKLMGQINLTRAAIPHLNDKGSITLISGILSEEPINWGRARPPSTAPSITSSRRRPASCHGVCASTW